MNLVELECKWSLDSTCPCESCGATTGKCYFLSDGGYEPRDGRYLCESCITAEQTDCERLIV